MTDVPCPICGKLMYPTRKHTLDYRWLQCNDCGHWRLAIPDDEADRLQGEGVNKEKTRCYPVTHAWRREQWLRTKQARFDSVLDVGCGTGAFLLCFPEAATRVGISMDVATQAPSDEITHIDGDFSKMPMNRQFELVTAWHVVEHALDPVDFMLRLLACCAPDGLVAVEIPMDRHLPLKGTYDGHPHRFSTTSWALVVRKCVSVVECMELGAGFCPSSCMLLMRKTLNPGTSMHWSAIMEGSSDGGKYGSWGARDKLLGEYVRKWPSKELFDSAKGGLKPGYELEMPARNPDRSIKGIQ